MKENSYLLFLKTVLILGTPLALQSFLFSSGGFVDNFIMSRLGTEEVVASSIGARVFWFASAFVWGIGVGMSVLLAQYWGAKDHQGLRKNYVIGNVFSILVSLPIFIFCLFFPDVIPKWFNTTGETADLTAVYLQIISFAILFSAPTITMEAALRSIGKTKITLYFSIFGMFINIFISMVLVFGYFGLPEMGLVGAALGTAISRVLGVFVCYFYMRIYIPELILNKSSLSFSNLDVKKYFSITLPVIIGSLIWTSGYMVYQLLIGQMGEAELAVMAVIAAILPIGLSLASGLSGAVAIVIGNQLGADERELSEKYSRYAFYSSVITGGFCAALLIVLNDLILSMYTGLTQEAVELLSLCLPLLALKLFLVNVNLTLIVGVLRAGGDAKFCMNMDTLCQWGWAIPMVAFSALWLGLPLPFVFFFMLSEEIVKIVPTLCRVFSNKWMNNLTKEPELVAT